MTRKLRRYVSLVMLALLCSPSSSWGELPLAEKDSLQCSERLERVHEWSTEALRLSKEQDAALLSLQTQATHLKTLLKTSEEQLIESQEKLAKLSSSEAKYSSKCEKLAKDLQELSTHMNSVWPELVKLREKSQTLTSDLDESLVSLSQSRQLHQSSLESLSRLKRQRLTDLAIAFAIGAGVGGLVALVLL